MCYFNISDTKKTVSGDWTWDYNLENKMVWKRIWSTEACQRSTKHLPSWAPHPQARAGSPGAAAESLWAVLHHRHGRRLKEKRKLWKAARKEEKGSQHEAIELGMKRNFLLSKFPIK